MESLKKRRRLAKDKLQQETSSGVEENHHKESTTRSSSSRINSLRSELIKLSNIYPELDEIKEFPKILSTLKFKEHRYENEENCPLYHSLPQDMFNKCLSFLDKSYGFVAPVSKHFHESYKLTFDGDTETDADFECLSKEAGVYLIESFPHEFSCSSSEYSLGRYLFGKDWRPRPPKGRRRVSYSNKDYLIHKAARQGNLDLYKHYIEKGYKVLNAQDNRLKLFEKLGENGHLHILQYLQERNFIFQGICFSVMGAALSGQLDIVKWAHNAIGCFTNKNRNLVDKLWIEGLKHGQIEMLTWFEDNVKSVDFAVTTQMIINSNNLKSIKFFMERDWPSGFDQNFVVMFEEDIIATENLDIVKFFVEKGFPMTEKSTAMVIEHESVEILKYLISIGVEWVDEGRLDDFDDSFEMMKLRFERYRRWEDDVSLLTCVMEEGKNFNIGMLKYLFENQCPLGDTGINLLYKLMDLKQIEILKFICCNMLYLQDVREFILRVAIEFRWLEGMEYIFQNCEGCSVPYLNEVLKEFQDINVFKLCKSHSMKWYPEGVIEEIFNKEKKLESVGMVGIGKGLQDS